MACKILSPNSHLHKMEKSGLTAGGEKICESQLESNEAQQIEKMYTVADKLAANTPSAEVSVNVVLLSLSPPP